MTAPGEWIIVRRELRGSLTRWRHVLAVMAWLTMTSLITYARWPQDFSNPQAYRTEAQHLLLGQCLIMILALSVTIPALAVSTLTREHEQETFDQLRLTLLQAGTIARGKMFASAFVTLLFIACSMPMFGISQFLLGLDNQQIVTIAALLLFFAVMIAAACVAIAATLRRFVPSILVSYLVVAGAVTIPLAFSQSDAYYDYVSPGRGIVGFVVDFLCRVSSPFYAIAEIANNQISIALIAAFLAYPAMIIAVSYAITVRGVRNSSETVGVSGEKLLDDEQLLLSRRAKFPYYLVDPLQRSTPISDRLNPIVVREFRWGLFRRMIGMIRFTYAVFVVSALSFSLASMSHTLDPIVFCFIIEIAVFGCAIPAIIAGSLAAERQTGNLDMIRMTLLPARSLLTGKTLGGLSAVAPALVAATISTLPAMAVHSYSYFAIGAGVVTLLTCTIVGAALSIGAAVLLKKQESAVTAAIAVSFTLFFGLQMTVRGLVFLDYSYYYVLNALLLGSSPLPLLSPIVAFTAYVADPSVPTNSLEIPTLAPWWLLSAGAYIALSGLILLLASAFFMRYRMRDA